MPWAAWVQDDRTGITLGVVLLVLVVVLAKTMPPLSRFAQPFINATRVYLRLFAISLPLLVIGGLLIAFLSGSGLQTEIAKTLVPALVVVLGWFVTFVFQEDRRTSERRADQHDLQIALWAEISTYVATFDAYDLAEAQQHLEREIAEIGDSYVPFLMVERAPMIFQELASDLHRLEPDQVNAAVQFYTRLQDMRAFAQELNTAEFRALPMARRRIAYLDYYAVRDLAQRSARLALRIFTPDQPSTRTESAEGRS